MSVELLDAGQAPRQVLRYAHQTGQTLDMRMLNDMTMKTDVGTNPIVVRVPTEAEATISTLDVDARGLARRRSKFTAFRVLSAESSAGSNAAVPGNLEAMLKGMDQVTIDDAMDRRGFIHEAHADFSAIDNEQLREMMKPFQDALGQCATPWPKEPVGLGAKWRVTRKIELGSQKLDQKTTVTLTRLDLPVVETSTEVAQVGQPGEIELPQGMKGRITSSKTSGSGSAKTNLETLSFDSTGTVSSETIMTIAERQAVMTMTLKLTVSATPRSRAEPSR